MRRIVPALLAALFVAVAFSAAPARAADAPAVPPRQEDPLGLFGPRLRDALQNLSRSLAEVFQSLPRYGAPQMLDNGDIVIRRMPPARPETIDPSGTRPGANRPIAV